MSHSSSLDGMPDTLRMETIVDQTTEKRPLIRKSGGSFRPGAWGRASA